MLGSKAMKFSDLKLGFADATKELMFEPEIFEKAFWDPNDIMDKLLNSWKYILAGRKGVGKSAFSARIIRTANENKTIYAKNLMLNEFEYTTFAKASSDVNTVGAKRYVNAWNFVIMFQLYKYIYEEVEDKGIEKGIKSVVELLSRMKLPIELNFNKIVGAVSRLKMGVNVGVFDAEFESEFGHEPTSFAEKISSIVERMEKTLEKVSIEKKIYLLIDGVDDILRIKKNQIDILSSLLRSIDLINTHFVERKINIKVLLFIREDILTLVNDPDLNKIKRDGLINLSWSNKADDLMEIVELRLHYNKNIKMEEKLWNTFFPEELKGKPSWDYILEHTLYKPRDLLQFLKTCQDYYGNREKLLYAETNQAIKAYSREYFIEEMKNELSGYIKESLISILPRVFSGIATNAFVFEDFIRRVEEQKLKESIDETDLKQLLLILFEAGYIGHLVEGRGGKVSVLFKYRNPSVTIDYSQRFLIHRGIQKGLGVKL